MSKFQNIELWFSELLTAAAPVLSSAERDEIQRFIDVGEYGLALEAAVDIYAEEKKIASAAVIALIERLAKAMELKRLIYCNDCQGHQATETDPPGARAPVGGSMSLDLRLLVRAEHQRPPEDLAPSQ